MVVQLGELDVIQPDDKYDYSYYIFLRFKIGNNETCFPMIISYGNYSDLTTSYLSLINGLDSDGYGKWFNTTYGGFPMRNVDYIAPIVAYNVPEGQKDTGTFKDEPLFFKDVNYFEIGDDITNKYNHIKFCQVRIYTSPSFGKTVK